MIQMSSSFVIDNLNKMYPNPMCELTFNKDYELLLKVMLSAQTTDKRVNMIMDDVFMKYDTLDKLDSLSIEEIESLIKSIGMYKVKARNFKSIVSSLVKVGYVPNDREFLCSLSGVGRKTANVVLSVIYHENVIAVDTHVERVSKRLGLVKEDSAPLEVERELTKKFRSYDLVRLHEQLVLFGRYKCKSKSPICMDCPFISMCSYYKKKKH